MVGTVNNRETMHVWRQGVMRIVSALLNFALNLKLLFNVGFFFFFFKGDSLMSVGS